MTTPPARRDTPPLDLGPIIARLDAITSGEWEVEGLPYRDGQDDPVVYALQEDGTSIYVAQTVYDMQSWSEEHDVDADTDFVAHAPSDMRALVAEVEALRADLSTTTERLNQCLSDLILAERSNDG